MAQKKTKIDFQQEINDKYGDGYTVISSEGGVRGTMIVQHDCGSKWTCSPRTINDTKRTSKYFCPTCAKEYRTSERFDTIRVESLSRWNNKLILDEGVSLLDYIQNSSTLVFGCSICNDTFTYHTKRVPDNVCCRNCKKKLNIVKETLPKELTITHSYTTCLNGNNREFITLRHNCPNCNYAEFTTRIDVFTSSEPRCYICERMEREPMSKPVRDLSSYFDSKGISYRREVVLPDCVNPSTGFPLRFDFEVETPNGLKYIEYDGEQHFMQVEGWESLESNKYRDQIKNEYCKRNNIALLRVPYTELPNIYDIVDEFISVNH